MIPGQLAFVGMAVNSPWMPKQADNCRFLFQKIDHSGTVTVTVKVATKALETAGDPTPISSPTITLSNSDTNGDIKEATFPSLNELVRFEYQVTGTTGDWLLFQMLTPSWFDTPNV